MTGFLVASDWHLAPGSPEAHGRLALAFLERARASGATVVLNGDVFDDLFSGPGRAGAAHPRVAAEIAALAGAGRLLRTRGNHDPAAGEERVVLEVPGVGRVLVLHGHQVDPIGGSAAGRIGDAISRTFGRSPIVRAAAHLAEAGARAVAGGRMAREFQRRAASLVAREGFDLGVFGHLHVPLVAPAERYANAGALAGGVLSFLELRAGSVRLRALRAPGVAGIAAAEMG